MKKVIDIITELENGDASDMTCDEVVGYLRACEDIKSQLNAIMGDKKARWELMDEVFAVDLKEDLREIMRRRF